MNKKPINIKDGAYVSCFQMPTWQVDVDFRPSFRSRPRQRRDKLHILKDTTSAHFVAIFKIGRRNTSAGRVAGGPGRSGTRRQYGKVLTLEFEEGSIETGALAGRSELYLSGCRPDDYI
ncbi:hypothetical protein GWI33_005450 [Rhynchophorus ferrugineus]|uniref:Uncharacterized protein n=1 Tax=Rhynchophorus ferrugineus TaxID=354439 RepID=A0A834IHG5_RHYFE|nr:hypothetical protein GWI33_005450 [Rhynchophorus ferrugineus]